LASSREGVYRCQALDFLGGRVRNYISLFPPSSSIYLSFNAFAKIAATTEAITTTKIPRHSSTWDKLSFGFENIKKALSIKTMEIPVNAYFILFLLLPFFLWQEITLGIDNAMLQFFMIER
jgi:hypothetical protein